MVKKLLKAQDDQSHILFKKKTKAKITYQYINIILTNSS